MTSDLEALSRLLDGDLPRADEEALLARIDAEPELAAAWEAMMELPDQLAGLPDEMVPPELPASVLEEVSGANTSWAFARLIPWAVAAAVLVFALWPVPAQHVVLLEGTQWVQGDVDVLAGDVVVEVDGIAEIFVEPETGGLRGVQQPDQESPMNKSTVLAAVAGAVVTVAVYQGTAVVKAASSPEPVVVQPGDVHTVGGAPKAAPAQARPVPGEAPYQTIARLTDELEAVKQELKEAQFTGAVARGQLQAHMGEFSEWPDDAPAGAQPDAFEANLAEALADMPGVKVASVDCNEYPCVAAIEITDPGEGVNWGDDVAVRVNELSEQMMGGESASISVNRSRFQEDGVTGHYVIFGAHEGHRDSDVGARLEFRMDGMIDELGEVVRESAAQP